MDKNVNKIYETMSGLFKIIHKLQDENLKNSDFADLSRTEIHAVTAIGIGRPKTMTHVANILEIKVSTLTSTVNKLVKKGYVERLRDDKDRRIVKVALTDKGEQAAREYEQFMERIVKGAVSQVPFDKLQYFVSAIDNINQYFMAKSSMVYVKTSPFELKPIKLGPHELPVPIVQAGMSICIAGAGLASSVAAEGGLGLIGTTDIGYRRPDYEKDRLTANIEGVREAVSEAKRRRDEAGGGGLIGVTVMWSNPNAPAYVDAAVKSGAQVIVTSGSIPRDLPKYCGDKKVALVPTVSSKRAASAIIRTWSQKYNRMPDGFILQGPFAAGLLGFREDQLDRAEQEWHRIIADIKSELSKFENCPLIVGGGIFTKEDAETAYKYGADGFLMGTRFVLTEECDAPDEYKKRYLNCERNDVTIIRSPMKTSVRAMKNSFTDRVAEGKCEDYDIFEAVKRSVEGDYDGGLMFCSEQAESIGRIDTVKDVFREFET